MVPFLLYVCARVPIIKNMAKKFYKNEKFQAIFFPILYFILTVSIVATGCYIFYKKYYQPIVVDGSSMQPTLVGGGSSHETGKTYRYHYGLADLHNPAINNLKRFDVVVTYYPSSWMGGIDKTYKIKRVWGFPGETIKLTYDSTETVFTFTVNHAFDGGNRTYKSSKIETIQRTFEVEHMEGNKRVIEKTTTSYSSAKFSIPSKSFNINAGGTKREFEKTLEKNEYFVMGDNWASSTDSYEKINMSEKLTRKYIQGRVLFINAYVSLKQGEPIAFHKFKERYYF